MADYWKSNPRHYCEACKCWLGDNKISIEFHESGRRHKANVERQLRESRKRASVKDKEAVKLSETLEQIEKAALASFARDQEGLPPAKRVAIATGITPTPDMIQFEQNKIRKEMEEKLSKKVKELDHQEEAMTSSPWQQLTSPEGYPYYYNSITGVSQWEPPPDLSIDSAHSTEASTNSQETPQYGNKSTQNENESTRYGNESTVKREDKAIKQEAQTDTPTTSRIKQEPAGSSSYRDTPTSSASVITGSTPYGAWTTIATREQIPPPTLANEEHNVGTESSITHDGSDDEDEGHTLQEKILPTMSSNVKVEPGSFKGFSFKKKQRKANNIKERTSDW